MAFASAHFAVGMACGAGVALVAGVISRRWRRGWVLPAAMTVGGVWGCVPDLPRVWRDYPSLPLSGWLGDMGLERWLHGWGDVFCFHRMLDARPDEWAVAGLAGVVLMYNVGMMWVWISGWRGRKDRKVEPGLGVDGLGSRVEEV